MSVPRLHGARGAGTLLVALALAVYLPCALAGVAGGRPVVLGPVAANWLETALSLAAAAICWLGAARHESDRRPWRVLAVTLLGSTVAQLVMSVFYDDVVGEPLPSVAALIWLSCYVGFFVFVLLVRREATASYRSLWLDGLTGGLAVAALGATVLYEPVVRSTGGGVAEVATALAYPLLDVLLVAFVLGVCALQGWRPGRAWLLLGAGLLMNAVADAVNVTVSTAGEYPLGTLLDVIWVVAQLLMALAPWQRPAARTASLDHARVLAFPAVFATLAVGLLVYGQTGHLNVLADVLSVAVLAVVGWRTFLSFRDHAELAERSRQALVDDLTALSNRRAFLAHSEQALAAPGRAGHALLMIDLDRFKELNDSLGHRTGDLLLCAIARRLEQVVPRGGFAARLGGDEFAVLLRGCGEASEAAAIAEGIRDALREPLVVAGIAVQPDASIGIALHPADGLTIDELLQHADVALYQAKKHRSRVELYDIERDPFNPARLAMAAELAEAGERNELRLYYQPKLDVHTGAVVGVEALLRWEHPAHGLVLPAEFLARAEGNGLIIPLTSWVLDTALADARRWADGGHDLTVAVNISAANLSAAGLVEEVDEALRRHGVPARRLTIELTESMLITDADRARQVLDELAALGVAVSLDDFGTGYSSLAHLQQLPVREIKIDRAFVGALPDETAATLVRSLIDLAHGLGLQVVAEGVEGAEAWRMLAEWGCDQLQGFAALAPAPAHELENWLAGRPVPIFAPLEGAHGARRIREGVGRMLSSS
jgi:diguanylate cyclase (GGDEF)-like protein